MTKHYQVCPVEPINGACPESLVWEAVPVVPPDLDIETFQTEVFPAVVGALLIAVSFRFILKLFFR